MASRNQMRDSYSRVMDRVSEAAERSGRRGSDVMVVAVTKTASHKQIRQLLELGHQDLGESRVQQLQQRVAMIDEFLGRHRMLDSDETSQGGELSQQIRWHMIGHLQRNKAKAVLPLVRLIHSVDSLRLVEEIHTLAANTDREVDMLLQVNIADEKQKFGLGVPAVPHLAEQIQTMMHIRLRGLMVMAPYSDDPKTSQPIFERAADLFNEMQTSSRYDRHFNILSMGMTNDFETAIECGANMVRIGRALFGEKKPTE